MAEIVLKIPKEFEQDFDTDKFRECFERVLADCKAWDYAGLSGNYEHETLEMLLDAFNEAVVLPKGHGRLRLIEEDKLDECKEIMTDISGENDYAVRMYHIRNWSTSIEADKEKKDESVS